VTARADDGIRDSTPVCMIFHSSQIFNLRSNKIVHMVVMRKIKKKSRYP
jgi:hypothetical protein